MPKVSIIIPIYNTARFLPQCLSSAATQTYKNLEILCIDDGSTDESAKIIKKYCQTDPRFIYIQKVHTNAGDTRNLGLKHITGKYVAFLDSDDFLEQDIIYNAVKTAEKDESDIVVYLYKLFDNNRNKSGKKTWGIHTQTKKTFNINTLTKNKFTFTNIAVWNKLYRADFLKQNNLYFQSYTCLNDMFFGLASIALADRISLYHNVGTNYRINVKNSISTKIDYIFDNFFNILEETNNFLKTKTNWETIKSDLLKMEQQQLKEFANRLTCASNGKEKSRIFTKKISNFISQYQ